jgi:hypothetical protein
MSSVKQFLLSLFATTVSIALTFGTAAIIDYNKKQKEKHEIVMMVMYDMYNSLSMVQKADSLIHKSMLQQRKIAEDTTKSDLKMRIQMVHMMPRTDYTETIERIFSSSIETINTVGNMFFIENVAEFYCNRKEYKTMVCDSVEHFVFAETPFRTNKGILQMDYYDYALVSGEILIAMQHLFEQCKQMMDISDEEIDAYRKEREKLKENIPIDEEARKKKYDELYQLFREIKSAKKELKLG